MATSRCSTRSSAGLVMGVMILPTVASLSEDAMTAVPMACARAPTRWAPRSCRSSDARGRAGRAVGHRRRRSCSAISRAIGETMIVADRRRRAAEPRRSNPLEAIADDDRVHRAGRHRRRADRLDRVQDDLRRRRARCSSRRCCMNMHQHPARAQVPRGVRVSTARTIGRRIASQRERRARRGASRRVLLVSLLIGFATLAVLLITVAARTASAT